MNKLKAYTLVEILVALTISSIIIVLAVATYFQLTQTNNRILRDYSNNADLLQLQAVLKLDFERSNTIQYSIYELSFMNKKSQINYEFSHVGILRKYQEKIDTFKVHHSDLDYKLQNGNTGNVTEFSFKVDYHKEQIEYSFYKQYLSEYKVNKQIFN